MAAGCLRSPSVKWRLTRVELCIAYVHKSTTRPGTRYSWVANVTEPTLEGDKVALRPTEPGDADALRAILGTPEVAIRWGPQGEDFPFDDDTLTRLTVLHDGEVIGLMQYYEEPDPDARSADVDIFIAPERHDRGLGTDAVRTLSRHLLEERGHHRLTLTTATDNHRAIRAYEKAGFRRVGVLEASAWSHAAGGWRDELLMERVERPAPSARSGL